MGNLTPELEAMRDRIRERAASYGLDFYEVVFELVDHDELNMVAAYGGFPTRYPHWRFGMEFEELYKGYKFGLSKIYELVINNDPCYAYLMRSNSLTEQKLVMAHVYGHCDFFKNNLWFSRTDRKMMDTMANHGTRIRSYMDRYGVERVENFVDCVLSLDNLIDIHSPYIRRQTPKGGEDEERVARETPRIRAKSYMDRYINPPEFVAEQRRRIEEESAVARRFPPEPARDVLLFLLEHAPLERWEQDILGMLREEAYYFAPQAMTKIMNEGWAVYWHSLIMTRHMLTADEVVDYADQHSGTLGARPGQINPYKLGVELFRDIEDRWDKGKFGLEYERCEDVEQRRKWDKGLMQGRSKIFEVRKIYNDVSFVDEFLTEDFAEEQNLFVYALNRRTGQYEIVDRDYRKVKEQLLWSLTNFGQPVISVANANHANRGELYLVHDWNGVDLKFDHAVETLRRLQDLWKRPVHLETREGGQGRLITHDGKEAVITEIAGSSEAPDLVGQASEDA